MTFATTLPHLLAQPRECEWVEFKQNNDNPDEIGEYISSLANSAAIAGQDCAWLVWGVEDATHRVVGTTARPRERKVGNEELENWLAHNLAPRIGFSFFEEVIGGHRVVGLRVEPAVGGPVAFRGSEWIRVGSIKKKLKDHPAKARELWRALERRPFEVGVALTDCSGDDVLALLDYTTFFELSGQTLPTGRSGIFERLAVDRLIVNSGAERFDVTNLGAILFAKDLNKFTGLSRKALRIVKYRGSNRLETEHERPGAQGYAAGFEAWIGYIGDQVPGNEVLGGALRHDVKMYPPRAIRELVANALIHQDFAMTGTGPMVEIFQDRIEVSNPGLPLIDKMRFIDHSPRSRNEVLADLMRRLGICEERGSGFDKVVADVEAYQLPAPDVRTDATHTRVVLFGQRDLAKMDRGDRIRACYQHCCLRYVTGGVMTNTSLRQRFGLSDTAQAVASRIIRETVQAGLVKAEDPENRSRKHTRYVPFWE